MPLAHIGTWLAASFLICAAGVVAQPVEESGTRSNRADYAWIDVATGAGGGRAIQGYDGWTPGPEPFLALSTPFMRGRAHLRFSLRSWASDRSGLPSFTALFGSAGWAPDVRLGPRLTLLPGMRAGNYLMSFRTDQIVGQRVESEFAIEPYVRLSARISERLALDVEGAAIRVFTSPRLDHASLRGGISWRFAAPAGLRGVLQ